MDQMGSPFLLAHGLGVPVQDATTTVEFPASGTDRLWVRTRDWVATWSAPGTPGRFQVVLDGKPVETDFGTQGAHWHWQDGGRVEIAQGTVRIALHDLTGFEGRCDVLLFTTDPTQLVQGLVKMGLPYPWGLTVGLAVHYLPTTYGLFVTVSEAQQARGWIVGQGIFARRARSYVPILVATIIAALRLSDNLGLALLYTIIGARSATSPA